MQETHIQFLGSWDPLEKGMDTHSSIPAWRIPWTEEPGGLQSMGCKESNMIEWLTLTFQVGIMQIISYTSYSMYMIRIIPDILLELF